MTQEQYKELVLMRQFLHAQVRAFGNHKIMSEAWERHYIHGQPLPKTNLSIESRELHQLLYGLQQVKDTLHRMRKEQFNIVVGSTLQNRDTWQIQSNIAMLLRNQYPEKAHKCSVRVDPDARVELSEYRPNAKGSYHYNFHVSAGWNISVWKSIYERADRDLQKTHLIISSKRLGNSFGEVHFRKIKYVKFHGKQVNVKEGYFACSLSRKGIYAIGTDIRILINDIQLRLGEIVMKEARDALENDLY